METNVMRARKEGKQLRTLVSQRRSSGSVHVVGSGSVLVVVK